MELETNILEDIRLVARLLLAGHRGFARELLRDGPSSIAFVPDRADLVVKALKPGQKPFGDGIKEEFASLKHFAAVTGEKFAIPRAVGMGINPEFLVMSRVGVPWKRTSPLPNMANHIGAAVGEFTGKLFKFHRAVHMDLFMGNLTQIADGRVGIVDIASIKPSDVSEEMFVCPILDRINYVPAMAEAFTAETGHKVDIDLVEKLTAFRWKFRLEAANPDETDKQVKKAFVKNFAEWREAERNARMLHRGAGAGSRLTPG